jgi:hypothetical protein
MDKMRDRTLSMDPRLRGDDGFSFTLCYFDARQPMSRRNWAPAKLILSTAS